MKKFLFIIARTPAKYRTPLRDRLWELSKRSLEMQRSNDWQALVVGDESSVDNEIIYLKSDATTKAEKLLAAVEWISNQPNKPEYLIRFDDDDLFNPFFLESVKEMDHDCFADRWQAHIDMISGESCLNDYPWLANTIVQKTVHALSTDNPSGKPLIVGDHSKLFHDYYRGKNVFYTRRKHPLYMRVLSPTCVSIGQFTGGAEGGEYDFETYRQYKRSVSAWKRFLFWRKRSFADYRELQKELTEISAEYFPGMKG